MSDYKRLISYIYEYEGKTKGKNIGFVKLEARNGQCRLNVNVKKVYVGGNAVGVFLLGKGNQETFSSVTEPGSSAPRWMQGMWREPGMTWIHITG